LFLSSLSQKKLLYKRPKGRGIRPGEIKATDARRYKVADIMEINAVVVW